VRQDGQLLSCAECRDLLNLHTFQVALNKRLPANANLKYTPNDRRDPEVGNIYLKVKGVRDLVETVCAISFTQSQYSLHFLIHIPEQWHVAVA
jgi:hypothetical protein